MRKADALNLCVTEGSLILCASLPEGKCLKFSGGSFLQCDLDGSNEEAITTVPTDADGWEIVELPDAPTTIAFHRNKTSGNTFMSVVGSDKFQQREVNTDLERILAPVFADVA